MTNLGAHSRIGAPEQATTGQPDRNANSQQQSNQLVRKQLHSVEVYSRGNVIVEA